MNAYELYRVSGKSPENEDDECIMSAGHNLWSYPTGVFACSNCGSVHGGPENKEWAEKCCKCVYCGETLPAKFPPSCSHVECVAKVLQKSKVERVDKLEVVRPEDVDWGNLAIFGSTDCDVYEDEDSAYDFFLDCMDDGDDLPEFWQLAEKELYDGVDISWVLENANEFCEDGQDYLCGLDALESAVSEFNQINKDMYRWIDSNRKFRIADFIAWIEGKSDVKS